MTLYDVTVDDRRMTGLEIGRHAVLRLDRTQVRDGLVVDLESVLLQVDHPLGAAASARITVDGDRRALRRRRRPRRKCRHQRRAAEQECDARSFHGHAAPPGTAYASTG